MELRGSRAGERQKAEDLRGGAQRTDEKAVQLTPRKTP